jgi:hypothetical protein
MIRKNYEGLRFGLLEILCEGFTIVTERGRKKTYVYCLCDCGSIKAIDINALKNKSTKSCGCFRRFFPNGKGKGRGTEKRLIRIRGGMIQRCYNPNNTAYKNYGDRGITVYKEWLDNPISFYEWAISTGYTNTLTIDRIDNNGPYSPENCRWVTMKEQGTNKRTNHILTLNGKGKTISEWSKELGIKKQTIRMRIAKGEWSEEKALVTPVHTPQGILIDGVFHTIKQAAKKIGINLQTVNSRLWAGASIEDALYKPLKKNQYQ